jgi:beta-glucosidase
MEAAQADAIMWGYLPAGAGGLAIAEIIFGVTNPSGALPITYPQFVNDIGIIELN